MSTKKQEQKILEMLTGVLLLFCCWHAFSCSRIHKCLCEMKCGAQFRSNYLNGKLKAWFSSSYCCFRKKTERYIYTYACKVLAQKAMFILVSNVFQDCTALLLLFSAQWLVQKIVPSFPPIWYKTQAVSYLVIPMCFLLLGCLVSFTFWVLYSN